MKELSIQERSFVENFLLTHNKTKAAIAAGYKENSAKQQGSQISKRDHVVAAITAAQDQRTERLEIGQDWVVEQLVLNHKRAMAVDAVLDKDGKETGLFDYKGSVANKCLELLGKHFGMWQGEQDKLPDSLPLEERLKVLQREDDINDSPNVQRLAKRDDAT